LGHGYRRFPVLSSACRCCNACTRHFSALQGGDALSGGTGRGYRSHHGPSQRCQPARAAAEGIAPCSAEKCAYKRCSICTLSSAPEAPVTVAQVRAGTLALLFVGLPVLLGALVYGPFILDLLLHRRPPSRFLIPSGYRGWVRIEYRVSNAPQLPRDGEYLLVRLAGDGTLKTSSDLPKAGDTTSSSTSRKASESSFRTPAGAKEA